MRSGLPQELRLFLTTSLLGGFMISLDRSASESADNGSAGFAALTAIFAKVGVGNVNSNRDFHRLFRITAMPAVGRDLVGAENPCHLKMCREVNEPQPRSAHLGLGDQVLKHGFRNGPIPECVVERPLGFDEGPALLHARACMRSKAFCTSRS